VTYGLLNGLKKSSRSAERPGLNTQSIAAYTVVKTRIFLSRSGAVETWPIIKAVASTNLLAASTLHSTRVKTREF